MHPPKIDICNLCASRAGWHKSIHFAIRYFSPYLRRMAPIYIQANETFCFARPTTHELTNCQNSFNTTYNLENQNKPESNLRVNANFVLRKQVLCFSYCLQERNETYHHIGNSNKQGSAVKRAKLFHDLSKYATVDKHIRPNRYGTLEATPGHIRLPVLVISRATKEKKVETIDHRRLQT